MKIRLWLDPWQNLDQATTELGKKYAPNGKSLTFENLKISLRIGDSRDGLLYYEVAKTLGIGIARVKTLIHRLRKQYASSLHQKVTRSVAALAEIDGETDPLCNPLIAAEGRLVQ